MATWGEPGRRFRQQGCALPGRDRCADPDDDPALAHPAQPAVDRSLSPRDRVVRMPRCAKRSIPMAGPRRRQGRRPPRRRGRERPGVRWTERRTSPRRDVPSCSPPTAPVGRRRFPSFGERAGLGFSAVLVGRTAECAAIDQVLAGARDGSSGVTRPAGRSGIGKSALLDYAMANAKDFAISRVTGVESEVALGFAAIHQLVLPFLGPRRRAARTAAPRVGVGLRSRRPRRRPTRCWCSSPCSRCSTTPPRERPMLLVIDDAQWLDDESARVLTFVARRLHADPIAMLFALRDTGKRLADHVRPPAPARGPRTAGGRRSSAAEVRRRRHDRRRRRRSPDRGDAGEPARADRVRRRADRRAAAGNAPLPEPLPVGRRCKISSPRALVCCRRRLRPCCCSRPRNGSAIRRSCIAQRGVGAPWQEGVASIEAAGLATFAPAVHFRHPLVRSAVYHGAHAVRAPPSCTAPSPTRSTATTTSTGGPGISAPPRQLRTRTSPRRWNVRRQRVFHRGGTQAAGEFLMRASELTPDPVAQGRPAARRRTDARGRGRRGTCAAAARRGDGARPRRPPTGRSGVDARPDLARRRPRRGTPCACWRARSPRSSSTTAASPLHALITAEDAALYAGSLRDDALADDDRVDGAAPASGGRLRDADRAVGARDRDPAHGWLRRRRSDAASRARRTATAGRGRRRDRDPERTRASQRAAPPRRERGRCPPR